jgi:hypothetical protein
LFDHFSGEQNSVVICAAWLICDVRQKPMTNYQLALLLIRFSAISFIYYGLVELPDFVTYYGDFRTLYSTKEETALATQNFARVVCRMGAEFFAGAFLFANTRHVIGLLILGRWQAFSPEKRSDTDENA